MNEEDLDQREDSYSPGISTFAGVCSSCRIRRGDGSLYIRVIDHMKRALCYECVREFDEGCCDL